MALATGHHFLFNFCVAVNDAELQIKSVSLIVLNVSIQLNHNQ